MSDVMTYLYFANALHRLTELGHEWRIKDNGIRIDDYTQTLTTATEVHCFLNGLHHGKPPVSEGA